jgi:hypothetical protein
VLLSYLDVVFPGVARLEGNVAESELISLGLDI